MDQKEIRQYQQKYKNYLMQDNIPFWLKHGMDQKNGGLYTCLDREGKLYNTDKSVWFQGRFAWILAKLCNEYGSRPEWEQACRSCLDFLNDHCIDTDRRMYFSVTADGRPLRKRRYFFSESFYTMAHAEAGKVFADEMLLAKARECYDLILCIYRDPQSDPYKITPKVIAETRSSRAFADPMIMLNVTHVMSECDTANKTKYEAIAKELTDDMFRYSYQEDFKIFLESVGPDGEFQRDVSGGRTVNPGHAIEGCWFLIDQANNSGDKDLLRKIETVFKRALDYGWDEKYGGIYAFGDVTGAPPEALEHDMKLWWPTSELIITSLYLYRATGKDEYCDWFKRADQYFFEKFADPAYGECFGYLHRDGTTTEPAPKGNLFKGPFHIPRMLILVERALDKM